jgi:pyroglutamyl-peptidase
MFDGHHHSTKLITSQEFLDIKINPSWEIVSLLPTTISDLSLPYLIHIITHPSPLKCAYHHLIDVVPKLLEQHNPDIVIHIGNAVDRDFFAIERGAERDGYHQYPDVDRKVFTKTETKKVWGKSPTRLESSLDCEDVLVKWLAQVSKRAGKEKKKGEGKTKEVNLRMSDDVGSYVCGFVYYVSLEWFWKRGERGRNVIFLHIPPLTGKEDEERGKEIAVALIRAAVESCGL